MRWRCWCSALEPGYCNWLVHRRASGRGVTGPWAVLPKPRGAGGATLAAQSQQGQEHSRPSLVDRRRTTRGAPLPPGAPRVSASARRNVRRPFHGPGEHEPSRRGVVVQQLGDRKSTRLNSSHLVISYAVFCLKKKKKQTHTPWTRPD